jgi:hypothetical protein
MAKLHMHAVAQHMFCTIVGGPEWKLPLLNVFMLRKPQLFGGKVPISRSGSTGLLSVSSTVNNENFWKPVVQSRSYSPWEGVGLPGLSGCLPNSNTMVVASPISTREEAWLESLV